MLLEGSGASIIFPHLGIKLGYFPTGFTIGKLTINFYGLIIALGMVVGILVATHIAKKTRQNPDDYVDYAIVAVIAGVIGARLYYVLFNLDYYIANPLQIFNLREGGLAVYGGVILGIASAAVVSKIKKLSFLRVMDTVAPGIVIAQAIGRWGNFVNREAYGEYTDTFFAMQIKKSEANGVISDLIRENIVKIDGVEYIQVHPTFLYESVCCLIIFVLIMIFRKYQRYKGEVLLWYIGGYALCRAFIEGLRTDQLVIGNTGIAVSQILSIALLAGSFTILVINRIRLATKSWSPEYKVILEAGDQGTVEYSERITKEKREAKANRYKEKHHGEEKQDASKWERQVVKEEEKTEEVKPEEMQPDEVKNEETKPEEIKPEEIKTEELQPKTTEVSSENSDEV